MVNFYKHCSWLWQKWLFSQVLSNQSKGFYNVLLVEVIWNEVMINYGHLKIELIHLTLRQNFSFFFSQITFSKASKVPSYFFGKQGP